MIKKSNRMKNKNVGRHGEIKKTINCLIVNCLRWKWTARIKSWTRILSGYL